MDSVLNNLPGCPTALNSWRKRNENAKTNILQSQLGDGGEKLNRQLGVRAMREMQDV